MNRKAFELSISAIVIIILGVLVLIGLALFLTGGFKNLKSSTEPFLDTTQSSSVKQACELACQSQDKLTYCCKEYNIDNQKIICTDNRLEVSCELSCENYNCGEEIKINEDKIDFYGSTLARWASKKCVIVKINSVYVNEPGPNAGGCSPAEYNGAVLSSNLKQIITRSNCKISELDNYFTKLKTDLDKIDYSLTKEQLAEDLKCLGEFEFGKTEFGYE